MEGTGAWWINLWEGVTPKSIKPEIGELKNRNLTWKNVFTVSFAGLIVQMVQ